MENLKRLRKERNLTTREMAEIINTSKTAFNNWETGKTEPSIEYLKALSNFFCVSVDFLIGNEPKREVYSSNVPQLTGEEKDLLKWFAGMNDVQKETLLELAKSLYNKNVAQLMKRA